MMNITIVINRKNDGSVIERCSSEIDYNTKKYGKDEKNKEKQPK